MPSVQQIIRKLDDYQQSHRFTAFSYAVIKKYGEDKAGQQAALLTYYSFLSLFPLLLVLTTVTAILTNGHPHWQSIVIKGTTNYFPVLGGQLSAHIHSLHRNGLALAVGLLLTVYGSRAVADAFRQGVQRVWRITEKENDGFLQALYKDFAILIVGGSGFIAASVITGFTAAAGHGLDFRLLASLLDLIILFWLFVFLLNISLPSHVNGKDVRPAAAVAAAGLVILQILGGYILSHELKNLDALYSYFALSLGLLFWIYLQAQLLYYAVEIASVRASRLWPRSLS